MSRPTNLLFRAALFSALAGSALQAANNYVVHKLVADVPSSADHADSNLVNSWGMAESATGPFWLANNRTGTATVYTTGGTALPLVVSVPSAIGSGPGAVTGIAFNSSTGFALAPNAPAVFVFCTEDGAISGWNSSVDATHAKTMADRSGSGAVYKGCAVGGSSNSPQIYAANFHSGTIDVFDASFKPVTLAGNAFVDPSVPSTFAPFNIQNLNGKLYVAYAPQEDTSYTPPRSYGVSQRPSATSGTSNGYVSVFDMAGNFISHVTAPAGVLDSPWGLTIAPANFGDFGGSLLVGNFGDGMIHAFNAATGQMIGTLNGLDGKPIAMPGLWGLMFGNGALGGDAGTLYFTAGSSVQAHGLLGSIQAAPSFAVNAVVNAASLSTQLAPNGWVSIFGTGLSASTTPWQGSDFVNNQLPTQIAGVGVTLNGEAAFVSYVSPNQINFLVPADMGPGPVQIITSNNGSLSAPANITFQSAAPSFFMFPGNKYIAATHSDGVALIGPANLIPGATTTPAAAGETVVLYANGFGPTTPGVPNGKVVTAALPLASAPTLTIGGQPANITFAGLSATGLYQINAVVPSLTGTGSSPIDAPVVAQISGAQSQDNAFLSVMPATASATPAAVNVVNFSFVPTPITVSSGAAITWTNKDGVQHTITSNTGAFNSGVVDPGSTFTQTITAPGTYAYHCAIHPSMKGVVTVQ